jgi:hypothetical protein
MYETLALFKTLETNILTGQFIRCFLNHTGEEESLSKQITQFGSSVIELVFCHWLPEYLDHPVYGYDDACD